MKSALAYPPNWYGTHAGDSKLMATDATNGNGRSTRGASKQRRDQIGKELTELRQLLPLRQSVRDRLFQLQVMSLTCTFLRKQQFLAAFNQSIGPKKGESPSPIQSAGDFSAALQHCFLLASNAEGRLLALSENFHNPRDALISTEEWMAQSDSLFDLIDPRDHSALRRSLPSDRSGNEKSRMIVASVTMDERVAFVCRWRAPKLGGVIKRQADWDGKPTLVEGRLIVGPADGPNANDRQILVALCRPLITSFPSPERLNELATDASLLLLGFSADLRFVNLCSNSKSLLGLNLPNVSSASTPPSPSTSTQSLYHFIHPSCVLSLAQLHRKLLADKSFPSNGHCLLLVLASTPDSSVPMHFHAIFVRRSLEYIDAIWQRVSDLEAQALSRAEWLYSSTTDKVMEPVLRAAKRGADSRDRQPAKRNSKKNIQITGPTIIVSPNASMYESDSNSCLKNVAKKMKPDLNNNSEHNDININCCPCWTEEATTLLEELPSLAVLPELDDMDLDEFFKQVEQRGEQASFGSQEEDGLEKRRRTGI